MLPLTRTRSSAAAAGDVRVDVFCPAQDRESLCAYHDGLCRTYAAHGVHVAENRSDDQTYLLLARDGREAVGGVGICLRRPGSLPAVIAELRDMPFFPALAAALDEKDRLAEANGLWVRKSHAGTGLSLRLLRAAVETMAAVGVETMVAVGHHRFLALYARCGLHRAAEFAPFAYPDERYLSYILWGNPRDCHPPRGRAIDHFQMA